MRFALVLSLALHVAVIAAVVIMSASRDVPLGDGLVMVEFAEAEGDGNAGENVAQDLGSANGSRPIYRTKILPDRSGNYDIGKSSAGAQASPGDANELNRPNGSPGSSTGNPILTKIRTKIERAKYYPAEARKQKLTGRPVVRFTIDENGAISSAELTKTSGSNLLDDAALSTVRRAAPLPCYSEPIVIAIKYSLAD
jgi:TonB family protein